MLLPILILLQVSSISITSIPSTGAPPISKVGSSAVYDSNSNSIITIGGQKSTDGSLTSEIEIFSLKSFQWSSRPTISEYVPSYLIYNGIHLRSDNQLLIFGTFSEIFSLNLNDFSWSKLKLKGADLFDMRSFAFTSVVLNNTEYLVVFGGISSNGFSNELTLIDVNSLTARHLPRRGAVPSPRNAGSISFYKNSFYVYGYSIMDLATSQETGSELFRYDIFGEYWEIVKTTGGPPGPRQFHYSCIFNDELYIFYGAVTEVSSDYDSVFKFNFELSEWVLVMRSSTHKTTLAAHLLIGSKIYFIYGRTITSFTNAVSFIDLSKDQLVPEYLSENWISPSARLHHCSFVVNENMYIFAGSYEDNSLEVKYLNDMWSFSFKYENWSYIQPTGDVPSERKLFGYTMMSGDILLLFGGVGPSGYLNDLYYFQEPSKKWTKILASNIGPTIRSESCLTFQDNILYIIGGRNDAGGFDEIWMYSFLTNEFSLHPAKIGGKTFSIKNILDAKCWTEQTDHLKLFIIGGSDSSLNPNIDLIELKIFENSSFFIENNNIGNLTEQALIGSETSVIKVADFILRLGGTEFGSVVLPKVFIFSLKNKTQKELNLSFNFFGHSAVHYKKAVYVFGGGAANEMYRVTSKLKRHLLKIDFSSEDSWMQCSPGTFPPDCEPCGPGTFSHNGNCSKCPAGKFNTLVASNSEDQCFPCPVGTFSHQKGSSKCFQCESRFNCPVGTSIPRSFKRLDGNSSVQPKSYQRKRGEVNDVIYKLWIASAVFCGFACFSSIFFEVFWKYLRKIDFFVSNHHNDLGVAIVFRKTSFGGLFSVFFVMVAVVTVSGGVLSFYLDNISEIQALVPAISLDADVKAGFLALEFVFYSYGGKCVENEKCSQKVKVIDDGILYANRDVQCSFKENDCRVKIEYLAVSLSRKSTEILVSLEERSSYSTALSLNISVSSSIPNEISSIFTVFETTSPTYLLKGTTPSIFSYKFTPSVFKSESTEWPSQETGFHIWPNQDPEIGSQADQESINVRLHLKAKVIITESDTGMQTQRFINQSWLAFIGTLLGSIFGIMGTVAAFMQFTESFSEKYEKKKMMRLKMRDNIKKHFLIDCQTSYTGTLKTARIAPTMYEIHSDR